VGLGTSPQARELKPRVIVKPLGRNGGETQELGQRMLGRECGKWGKVNSICIIYRKHGEARPNLKNTNPERCGLNTSEGKVRPSAGSRSVLSCARPTKQVRGAAPSPSRKGNKQECRPQQKLYGE